MSANCCSAWATRSSDVVNELVAENWKKILLNLSGVSSVDSAGVGELVASQTLREVRGADGS